MNNLERENLPHATGFRGAVRHQRRTWIVLAAGLAVTIWVVASLRIPSWRAASSPPQRESRPASSGSVPLSAWSEYLLIPGTDLRYVPHPSDAARRALSGLIWAQPEDVVSLTVVWGEQPYVRSATVGHSWTPRSLHDVLLDSLGLPPYMFEGLELSLEITLPGDWVLREGARPAHCLEALAQIVRQAGHPGFTFVPEEREQPVYTALGAPSPSTKPLELLARRAEHEPEAALQRGSVNAFLDKLSWVIHRRIRSELIGGDRVQVAWRDYSPLRWRVGAAPTESAVAELMESVATHLRIDFRQSRDHFTVWRLCDDCYAGTE